MEYPDTVKHPEAFARNKPANYDGLFDWTWTEGCFGDTKITPTDFDGVVERNKNYIIFETKEKRTPVKDGQQMALERLREAKSFTVMYIWGKEEPEEGIILFNGETRNFKGREEAREQVKRWYAWANKNENCCLLDGNPLCEMCRMANKGFK